MKTRFLIFLVFVTLGFSQISESFSEDSTPSCNIGVFVSDNIQCYTRDSPPCTEPSFEKNGLCVVKKIDICEKDYVLKDGFCMPNSGNFRIDSPTFTRQSLQTGETISPAGTFTSIIIGSLGPILIVLFIVIYAVKKRRVRKSIEKEK